MSAPGNRQDLPRIAISAGDPSGVGPEVCFAAIMDRDIREQARWVIIGESWMLPQYGVGLDCPVVTTAETLPADAACALLDRNKLPFGALTIGAANPASGTAALDYVESAAEYCLSGVADAMVTAPICKEAIVQAGHLNFTGHTERLGEICGVATRLMLWNQKLCVVHVSTHVSLAEAIQLCQVPRILKTIELGHAVMQRLGRPSPRIALCGLNPHASENGLFGDEERTVIQPAISAAKERGINCSGPYPADTLFLQAAQGNFDLVVAMYHDQGHAPMKLFDFQHSVNVTLGLPIIRTSVDHGTAFDIAGKGQADATNMKCAMQLAVDLVAKAG